MNIRTFSLVLVGLAVTGSAVAGGYEDDRYGYGAYPAPAGAYGYAEGGSSVEYATVLSTRPVYRDVRVSEPRQECYDQPVTYREGGSDYGNYGRSTNNILGTVIGGVVGGAVGHQFSRGSGRQIATAIGAVVGAGIGNNVANNNYDRYSEPVRERTVVESRCRTVQQTRYEQAVDGYDVTYRYQGRTYTTRMPYDPGNRLAVNVSVSPSRY